MESMKCLIRWSGPPWRWGREGFARPRHHHRRGGSTTAGPLDVAPVEGEIGQEGATAEVEQEGAKELAREVEEAVAVPGAGFLRSPLQRSVWLTRLCTNHTGVVAGRASPVEDEQTHTGFENLVQYQ